MIRTYSKLPYDVYAELLPGPVLRRWVPQYLEEEQDVILVDFRTPPATCSVRYIRSNLYMKCYVGRNEQFYENLPRRRRCT